MKIEKISDRQIRCTLSKKDLVDRELRLSELAYGTEKAKELFRDMMQQASYELGFEADDIPLMIEAIPVSSECLVLVVTKVDNPEELDTRFSKFTEDATDDDYDEDIEDYSDDENEDDSVFMDIPSANDDFTPFPKALDSEEFELLEGMNSENSYEASETQTQKIFSFDSLEDVIKISSIIAPVFQGESCLYKNPVNSTYYLSIVSYESKNDNLSRLFGMISEYGRLERTTYASLDYYNEHFDIIVAENAIDVLSRL